MTSAVVVGSGPNGLAAAIVLARAGVDVTVLEAADEPGGAARTAELTRPGLLHDLGAAAHPTAQASPILRSLPLADHGLRWAHPEIAGVHVLDGGRAGVLHRDLETTARGMGADADRWRRLFGPLVERAERIVPSVLGPILAWPDHPIDYARFAARAALPVTALTARWRTDEARGLMAAFAAHAVSPLDRPTTAGVAMLFGVLGHTGGWPVAVGGTGAISRAMVGVLADLGGRVETGQRVRALPAADLVLFDTAPGEALAIAGERADAHVRAMLRPWRHGPAAFKLDLAVEGGLPWTNPDARRAGTVHLGGPLREVDAAERAVQTRRTLSGRRPGRLPERPFVLLCQQYLADPSRSVGDLHPVWAYGHVPHGYTGDATEAILGQIERFAPGARQRIVEIAVSTPAALEAGNPNLVGGDISGGAMSLRQTVLRPRPGLDPYRLGPGLWLCSSSTPPGGGVHGMAGFHAATRALRSLP